MPRLRLEPLGQVLDVPRGAPLHDTLFSFGVEFPCGGRGKCRRCQVRVLEGDLEASEDQQRILTPDEMRQGWRLACRCRVSVDATLEIGQWEGTILADDSRFDFTPREGIGVAVDLGTTTLVAQVLDLRTADVLSVKTALNPQAVHGSDVMSRVEFALQPEGLARLTGLIRREIGELIGEVDATGVVIAGNTVMHHLFCGVDVRPLAAAPFEPCDDGEKVFTGAELGWRIPAETPVRFLRSLGGFVGSDILAGILATGIHRGERLCALLDLGTNGEIVVGNRDRLLCASTAAGPAFEGGRISVGMRAATGAISEVMLRDGEFACHVIGGAAPRGICGSGLVDAVAAGLDAEAIQLGGRLRGGRKTLPLCPAVELTQADIRELQLAKAAIASGVRLLLARIGAAAGDIDRLYLAGAFGNYVNRASARRIGLIDFPEETIHPAGNTALLGAKLALFGAELETQVEHVPLAAEPGFQDAYVDCMAFPETPPQASS